MSNFSKKAIMEILDSAGIVIGGEQPGDIIINNPEVFSAIAKHGSLGLGESYMDGWWDCTNLDVFFAKLLRHPAAAENKLPLMQRLVLHFYRLLNPQRKSRAFEVGEKHYDIGNDLYEAMLGESMVYTCAYWKDANDLTAAQYAKMDLICRKLQLKPGMKVLDIGCGFGSFAKYAAEHYKVHVTGVTISKEQLSYAENRCRGLDVAFALMDYRHLNGKYDAITSIGMFEHVGDKNYAIYMQKAAEVLSDDGLFLLHSIASNKYRAHGEQWISKYIFPNGQLPSLKSIAQSIEDNFVLEDLHNIGVNYDYTLMSWYHNFVRSWPQLAHKFDDRFYRMWSYYLLSCAGEFRARDIQVWQLLLSKNGIIGGLPPVR
jgi:cyclopropane-fatty-acyl-phospholipid synthase